MSNCSSINQRSRDPIIGVLGALYQDIGYSDKEMFLRDLQTCSSEEAILMVETAQLLADKFKNTKKVIWAYNDPFFEINVLKAAILPAKKTDPDALSTKIWAFNYIRNLLDIHGNTFPYVETFDSTDESSYRPNGDSKQNIPVEDTRQYESNKADARNLIAPAIVLGASLIVALNGTQSK